MLQNFLSQFDKKRLVLVSKIIVLFLFLIVTINILGITYSKYESNTTASGAADIAFFIVEPGYYEGTLSLNGLIPRRNPFVYTIDVSNFKDSHRTNVNLTYHIRFEATTNLPLNYEIYKDEEYGPRATNLLTTSNTSIFQDDNDVYYKKMEIPNTYSFTYNSNQSHIYKIVVYFPEIYKNQPVEYSNYVELFSIIITAEQVV